MQSTLKNMVLVLFTITLVSSACVGLVNMITEAPIQQAKEQAVQQALQQVLPEFDSTERSEAEIMDMPVVIYVASKEDQKVGVAVETATKLGFGGIIRMMVGFDINGKVVNINVLEHSETPGLGSHMTDAENPLLGSFCDKCPGDMTLKVKKDGGDVDALTAATISSRAYTDAVQRAYAAYNSVAAKPEPVQVNTGATMIEIKEE